MKKILLMLLTGTVLLGSCARPVNRYNTRGPVERRPNRRPPPPADQPGPDRRPGQY